MNWPAESIWEAVYPLLPDFTVEVLPHIDSTNSELMRRARTGQAEPTLLVAEQQTAGRGRLGRDWHSTPGDSLTFSLALPLAPADWAGLSLAVGVAVAQSLHADLQLKWPNDLWLHGRKLGGILIETAGLGGLHGGRRLAVVGVGLNIAPPAPEMAAGLATAPAWLQEVLPGICAGQALQRVAAPLVQAILAFERAGFAPFQAPFAQRDALRGRAICLSTGATGTACGVDAQGGLLVHTPEGLQTITSAEVSVRPAPTADPAG